MSEPPLCASFLLGVLSCGWGSGVVVVLVSAGVVGVCWLVWIIGYPWLGVGVCLSVLLGGLGCLVLGCP